MNLQQRCVVCDCELESPKFEQFTCHKLKCIKVYNQFKTYINNRRNKNRRINYMELYMKQEKKQTKNSKNCKHEWHLLRSYLEPLEFDIHYKCVEFICECCGLVKTVYAHKD